VGNTVSITPPECSAHTFSYGWHNCLEAYNPPATLSAADSLTQYAHHRGKFHGGDVARGVADLLR
jgi:hypothetical protein